MSLARAVHAAPARKPAAQAAGPAPVQGSSGTPSLPHSLPPVVRLRLERGFGADLSGVRVHTDSQAARALGTRAFASGAHIHLAPGNRPDDLRLMAHETAHVLQAARGAQAGRLALGGEHGALEAEASLAAERIAAGGQHAVQGRAGAGTMQGWSLGDVVGRVVDFLRERARDIPGYDLLALILGRDPITQQPVARTASNLLRALLGLIPGGAQMFANLQQARVIERAFDWANGELERLGLTWSNIRTAVGRFIDSLGLSDLANPGGVLRRARDLFVSIVQRVAAFAVAAGQRILEFIFEGALALGGGAAQSVLALFRRIGATFRTIVADPVRFLSNLINAVVGGFRRFAGNILEHLRNGLFDWLLGAMAGAGLRMPRRFDLAGIVDLVLQVLGLTYARLRERLVRLLGEPAVRGLEGAFEFLRTLVTQGLAATWRQLLEFASGLVDTVIEGIRNFVITRIVQAAVTRLATLFNPVGAVINAIIAIYNTVQFVIERARQIAAFVGAVLDSLDNIARGNIAAAVAYVERTLGRILSLAISFLASLIGLGGIAGRIREIIGRIRAVVDRALDRIVAWIGQRARGLASRVVATGRTAVAAIAQWWRIRHSFRTPAGQEHAIFLEGEPPNVRVVVQSDRAYLAAAVARIPAGHASKAPAEALRREIESKIRQMDQLGARGRVGATSDPARLRTLTNDLNTDLRRMAQLLGQAGILDTAPATLPRPTYRFSFSGGRATGAEVDNLTANRPMGSAPYQNPVGWNYLGAAGKIQGAPFFRRLHLVNHRLGGPGQIQNLVPGSQANNSTMESDYERPIKDKVGHEPMQAGKTAVVRMRIVVSYGRPAATLSAGGISINANDIPSRIRCAWSWRDRSGAPWQRGRNVSLQVPL